MTYDFLVETYATEGVQVVSVWSEFAGADLIVRPRSGDPRGPSVQEQMVHQCVSEDAWFPSSNYGPTADTGGLMQHHAPTIYASPA